jgi:hypothetical protein
VTVDSHRRYLSFLAACLGSAFLWGCGESKPAPNKAPGHLRKIIQGFDLAIATNRRPPRDAEELKPFLQQISEKEDPEEILRSPNDGQPYEIMWGVNPLQQEEFDALLAYEKNGVDGKRYVITVARIVKEMSDAEFKEARRASPRK